MYRCCRSVTSRSTQTCTWLPGSTPVVARKNISQLTRKMSLFFGLPFQPHCVSSEEKATRVLGIVFFTFILCWAPFFTLNIVSALSSHNSSIPAFLAEFSLWLGYTSSTINPVIYTTFNIKFRKSFLHILLCRRRGESNLEIISHLWNKTVLELFIDSINLQNVRSEETGKVFKSQLKTRTTRF